MTAQTRISGSWADVDSIYARVGGSWKNVDEGYAKISGSWQQFWTSVVGLTVNYLVIAGGGGGGKGSHGGGGGGAGGYRTSAGTSGGGASAESSLSLEIATNYTVTVGAGGANTTVLNTDGSNGSNSVFSTITSTGGGAGAGSAAGASGGSGGGARGSSGAGFIAGGSGTANQGFDGGSSENDQAAGGGGGAGEVGESTSTLKVGGNGGDGVQSDITGTSIYRGGGGGGASTGSSPYTDGTGGLGGGGDSNSQSGADSGTVNTGGGGGGSDAGASGSGGSGVVILKYPDTYSLIIGAGLTATTTTSGGYRVTQFTAGTDNISFVDNPADFELLTTTELASSASSVSFTGLGSFSDYKHLQIRYVVRTDRVSTVDTAILRFNSDSGSNYAWHYLRGDGSAVYSVAGTSQTYARIGMTSAASSTAGEFSAAVLDILDFSSGSKKTTCRDFSGLTGNSNVFLTSSVWNNTSAITQIDILPLNGTNFVANSRFSLFGLRAGA
jgi:hypothetical protein